MQACHQPINGKISIPAGSSHKYWGLKMRYAGHTPNAEES